MKRTRNRESLCAFIIWLVAALMVSLFMMVANAEAARTLHLVDQYHDENALICVYSDGRHYVEVERPRGSQHCPYTHIEY
ncbi:hypothetical protein P2R41_23125 [Escherichia coli]